LWAWMLCPPIREWWPGFRALWRVWSDFSRGFIG
jgi:hypothetical protein